MADNANPELPASEPIKLEQLSTVPAISALGLVAARVLQQHGIVTLMVGATGSIEIVPEGEIELDTIAADAAIRQLINRGYADAQIEAYLAQRDTRLARKR